MDLMETVTVWDEWACPPCFAIFEVVSAEKDYDFDAQLKKASSDFCKTEEGAKILADNDHNYNFGLRDFFRYIHTGKSFSEKYGFRLLQIVEPDYLVDEDGLVEVDEDGLVEIDE